MRYCLPYIRNFKYAEELDEVIIPYQTEDLNFLKTLLKKDRILSSRLIIDIKDAADFKNNNVIDLFIGIKKDYPELNFTLRFLTYSEIDSNMYKQLKEENIPFFFETYARNWDVFHGLIELGVSDIYIVESLAFELDKLGPIAHAAGVSIRVFANVCQASWKPFDALKSFFIRPEDIDIYADYVDVVEFYGDVHLQETMYKIYAHDKHWFGPLKEILIGFNADLDSRFIVPAFGKARSGCGKKCLKGRHCTICEKVVNLADSLKNAGVYIKKKN